MKGVALQTVAYKLIRLMTLQVISPSEQCTLHFFKVNYNYVTVFYVNLTYVSM